MEHEQQSLWKGLLTEYLATTFLSLTGCGAAALSVAQGGSLLSTALAFGLVMMVLFYTWNSPHANWITSFGYALAGQMNWLLMLGYLIAQFLGALTGVAIVAYLLGSGNLSSISSGSLTNSEAWKGFLLTALLSLLLVVTILLVTRNPQLAVVSGLIIGLTLAATILFGGNLVGVAAVNPAIALSGAIFANNWSSNIWAPVLGAFTGCIVAVLVYKLITINWNCCYLKDEKGEVQHDSCGRRLLECKVERKDACGNTMKSDCGDVQYETIIKPEMKHGYKQETMLHAIEQKISSGMSPRYSSKQSSIKLPSIPGFSQK